MAGGAANWLRALTGGSVIIGVGYLLLKTATPNEQELYDSLSPDLRRKVDAHRRAHVDAARAAEVKQEQELLAAHQDTAKARWIK
ncbi:assembly factor cbp4 [Malassezia caprae]|uniref:Assembly factor cbp4 n=1 Tax=Malassezia caprae TaxID=1381934 RepID=A0AAF0IUA6_9BASI|nr:assembly factor cbp4 [Malassezia caprae]